MRHKKIPGKVGVHPTYLVEECPNCKGTFEKTANGKKCKKCGMEVIPDIFNIAEFQKASELYK